MKEILGWVLQSFLIICLIIGILMAGVIKAEKKNDVDWNGGYHSCGGKWEYIQAVGHQARTNYLYRCDKCGEMKEFYKYRISLSNNDDAYGDVDRASKEN